MVARYEALRADVGTGRAVGSDGWRALIEGGVVTWMQTVTPAAEAREQPLAADRVAVPSPRGASPDELTRVLVALTLSCLEEAPS